MNMYESIKNNIIEATTNVPIPTDQDIETLYLDGGYGRIIIGGLADRLDDYDEPRESDLLKGYFDSVKSNLSKEVYNYISKSKSIDDLEDRLSSLGKTLNGQEDNVEGSDGNADDNKDSTEEVEKPNLSQEELIKLKKKQYNLMKNTIVKNGLLDKILNKISSEAGVELGKLDGKITYQPIDDISTDSDKLPRLEVTYQVTINTMFNIILYTTIKFNIDALNITHEATKYMDLKKLEEEFIKDLVYSYRVFLSDSFSSVEGSSSLSDD